MFCKQFFHNSNNILFQKVLTGVKFNEWKTKSVFYFYFFCVAVGPELPLSVYIGPLNKPQACV